MIEKALFEVKTQMFRPAGDHRCNQVIYSLFSLSTQHPSTLKIKQKDTLLHEGRTSQIVKIHGMASGLGVLLRSLFFNLFASADFDAPVHPLHVYSFSHGFRRIKVRDGKS